MSKDNKKKRSAIRLSNSHKKWIIVLLSVALILICGIVVMTVQISARDKAQTEIPSSHPTTQATEMNQPTELETMQATETAEHSEPTERQESQPATQSATQPTTQPTTQATKDTSPTSATQPTTKVTEPATEATENTKAPEPTIVDVASIDLPYVIPGTTLEVQKIADYDGMFLEDGTNATVSDVAMILLHNTSAQDVEYVEMSIVFENGELAFNASAIPGNGYIVIQERDRKSVPSGKLLECRADVAPIAGFEMSDELIQVVDNGDDSLSVTNLTDQELVTVRLFYKYYMEENDVYVGGITYTAKISNLAAKSTIVIEPTHYVSDSSKVVMVRTYDEDV